MRRPLAALAVALFLLRTPVGMGDELADGFLLIALGAWFVWFVLSDVVVTRWESDEVAWPGPR